MNAAHLMLRSFLYYWRSHAAVVAGVSVAAAVLTGSLIIGDSVRIGLDSLARTRIGRIDGIISGGDRLYRAALATRLQEAISSASVEPAAVAPVLLLPGVAANPEQQGRTGGIQVLGVDARFWACAPDTQNVDLGDGVAINEALAAALGLHQGDTLVLRIEKPGLLPRDAPQADGDGDEVAMRLPVTAVLDDRHLGRFSLRSGQTPPLNAWIPLATLQKKVAMPGGCSLFLLHASPRQGTLSDLVTKALTATWRPADADIEVRTLGTSVVEVRSHRVFLDAALRTALPDAAGILSYFVNDLQVGSHHTPYSLVAAGMWSGISGSPPELERLVSDGNDIVLNIWLADDLSAKFGDQLQLRYSVLGPMGALIEREATMTVAGVVPISGVTDDRELMPAFPGIADAANCKEWKPGLAIDLKRIRDKDEEYWKAHRGTPKAFVSLATGQRLWSNRFGSLTALRLDAARHPLSQVEDTLVKTIPPSQVGLGFVPLRERALAASAEALDFGGLFLSLGFFLIAAALVLAGLLMSLALRARRSELGLLLAVGLTPRAVRRLVMGEATLSALVGSGIGCVLGIAYAWVVLSALAGRWSAAVGGGAFALTLTSAAITIGIGATMMTAVATLWWSTRRSFSQTVRQLLAAEPPAEARAKRSFLPFVIALVMTMLAVGAYYSRPVGGAAASESFFMIGASLLIAALAVLSAAAARLSTVRSLVGLALANATRRRGRSLAVVSILSSAVFLVVAVGAFRRDGSSGGGGMTSGTGGFALIAESTVPIAGDLNQPATQSKAGLHFTAAQQVRIVGVRSDGGDDASCLNLNHSAAPRLFAVDPSALAGRFAVAQLAPGITGSPWAALNGLSDGSVPAIADQATAEWSLGKGVGDVVAYRDELGAPFTVRIIATLDHSLLQGGLFISEQAFIKAFPSRGGCSQFLIDASAGQASDVAVALSTAFSDHGLRVQPTSERLDNYLAVERTYLDIFQALGGCALLLGSAGVGIVLVQTALERRQELGMLRALGFTRTVIARLLLGEHILLFACAVVVGIMCGLIAVAPQVSAGGGTSWLVLGGLVLVLVVSGVLWMAVGTWWALRGALIAAVRSE